MEDGIADLLSFCSRIDFGTVCLSEEEEQFRRDLNPSSTAIGISGL
jgi:hypothetical protein